MADADVIPIGGRGAPGRGSRTTPSAAARALAPSTGRARARKKPGPDAVVGALGNDAGDPGLANVEVPKPSTVSAASTQLGAVAGRARSAAQSELAAEPVTERESSTGETEIAQPKQRPAARLRGAAGKRAATKAATSKRAATKAATSKQAAAAKAATSKQAAAAKAATSRPAAAKAATSRPAAAKAATSKPTATTATAGKAAKTASTAKTAGTAKTANTTRTAQPTPPPKGPAAARLAGAAGTPNADDLAEAVADAAREEFGDTTWERRLIDLVAFTRRRLTGDYSVDEFGFDPEITERFVLRVLRPMAEKWFRIEVRGVHNIPAHGGALVVSNHSGTLPVDCMMTALTVHDHTGRYLRLLGADLVFALPFFGELARKGGATLASNDDARRMLSRGDLVGVWPEGFKGLGKPYAERYKLQRFGRGGFVSAALHTGVPIVPCSVVGAEEIYPMIGNVSSLARLLGLPYLPVTPFFPLLGVLGLIPLPSKWLIEFGEPIRTDTYAEGAADDPMLVFSVTDQVRETIQQTLYTLLVRRRSVFS